MTQLFLIRHADYIEGKDSLTDLGLSSKGYIQAAKLRDRLVNYDKIQPSLFLSSTERRASETAEVIAPALGIPVTLESDLGEWRSDDGSIEAEAFLTQWQKLKERQRPFHRFVPTGETGIEFTTRVHTVLNRIINENKGNTIVLMTHGGFIQVAFQYFFGFGAAAFRWAYPAAGNTSITHWQKIPDSDRWILQAANDQYHLKRAV